MDGRLKPLVTGLALAVELDLLANDQNPHLTKCPKNRVHLTPARFPSRFPAPDKCTSHLGFGLGR